MAAGFSVKDALNKNSKAGIDESPRARFRTKDISIFKMYRNDMNFYSVEQIEELAGDILMYGLKQNLELVYAPCDKGEYRIVAGERRWEALKYLVSKGYKEFELATSKLTTPQDNDEEQVEIIIANAYRTKTTSDMIEEETRLKASLERMKAAGKKIKGYDLQSGRLRDATSTRTVQRHTRPTSRDIQRNRMQSTVRQRKNSVRWSRRRRCRTSHQTHRRPDRKCIRYALQSLISMMWQTESRHLNSERMTEDIKKATFSK